MTKRYNVLDLFCGCGGLSLGFEMAGFDVKLAIDNWEDALVTYRKNHKGTKTLNADLLNLNPQDVEQEYNSLLRGTEMWMRKIRHIDKELE